jgi:hypothetical protein
MKLTAEYSTSGDPCAGPASLPKRYEAVPILLARRGSMGDRFTNQIIGSKFPPSAFDCSDHVAFAEKLEF